MPSKTVSVGENIMETNANIWFDVATQGKYFESHSFLDLVLDMSTFLLLGIDA